MPDTETIEIDRGQRLLAGQIELLTLIARDEPLDSALKAIIAWIETLDGDVKAGVTILDRASVTITRAVFPSLAPTYAEAIVNVPIGAPHVGTCAKALYDGATAISEDVANEVRFSADWVKLCLDHGVASVMSTPVRAPDGAILGAFVLGYDAPRAHDAFDQQVNIVGARLVGVALERARIRERQRLVISELQHRTKNLFASIDALTHFSFANHGDKPAVRAFEGRLKALSHAHSLMMQSGGADLSEILRQVLAPYNAGGRVEIAGPAIHLDAAAASSFAMAGHELATNAAKYGALSNADGKLRVTWTTKPQPGGQNLFSLAWVESGGPHVVAPLKRGFGVRAIERVLAQEIEGRVHLNFAPHGLRCTIEAPLGARLQLGETMAMAAK